MKHLFRFSTAAAVAMLLPAAAPLSRAADPAPSTPAAPLAEVQPELSESELATFAKVLEQSYGKALPPESVRMLIAIGRGSQMMPGSGWFGPAQARYNWPWLAKLHNVAESAGIDAKTFRSQPAAFARLDRNKDGQIAADDFDWSECSSYVQQASLVNRLFRRFDQSADGRVTRDEILSMFDQLAHGQEAFRGDDLRDTLIGGPSGFSPGDAPNPEVLLRGLFRGEIGSLNEGPKVDEPAPDFRLKTHDGSRTVRLGEVIGNKPVVLVFGNFTCGPFRSMYPAVDELCQRYRDQAEFLSVYVREAHPKDGWKMESNSKLGVEVTQPQTYAERVGVAGQCQLKLKYSMPLLVDEIHDPVGNAYSGMPARLYVIDADGKVAYKSGRGPFGFKSGEMEQALLMTILDRESKAAPVAAQPAK